MTESLLKKSHKLQNDKGLNTFSPQKRDILQWLIQRLLDKITQALLVH